MNRELLERYIRRYLSDYNIKLLYTVSYGYKRTDIIFETILDDFSNIEEVIKKYRISEFSYRNNLLTCNYSGYLSPKVLLDYNKDSYKFYKNLCNKFKNKIIIM